MIVSQRNSPLLDAKGSVFTVSSTAAGARLDRCLAGFLPELSRSRIQAVVRSGAVLLNGAPAKPSERVRVGDEIVWREPSSRRSESASAQEMPIEVLFEDDFLAVVNKPAGMVVHPGAGNREGTLVSGLLHHFGSLSNIGGMNALASFTAWTRKQAAAWWLPRLIPHIALSRPNFPDGKSARSILLLFLAHHRGAGERSTPAIARHRVDRKKSGQSGRTRKEAMTEYQVLISQGP